MPPQLCIQEHWTFREFPTSLHGAPGSHNLQEKKSDRQNPLGNERASDHKSQPIYPKRNSTSPEEESSSSDSSEPVLATREPQIGTFRIESEEIADQSEEESSFGKSQRQLSPRKTNDCDTEDGQDGLLKGHTFPAVGQAAEIAPVRPPTKTRGEPADA